jgi:methyltransferase (TIGR00027 family)
MQTDQPSTTAEGAAIMRALHQAAEPRIFEDPIAPRLVDPSGDLYQGRLRLLASLPETVRNRQTQFVLRSRYAEDCLADAVTRGVGQYVVLGAGLDTFACRQPAWAARLRVYEVDRPVMQDAKRRRLQAAGLAVPGNVTYVPVDFEQDSFLEELFAADLRRDRPAFVSLLGVIQYLSGEQLDRTLGLLASLTKGSELVLSFVLPDDQLSAGDVALAATFMARFAGLGEPWLTRIAPQALEARLLIAGFSDARHLTTEVAQQRYFRDRSDGLAAPLLEQVMWAVV